MPESQTLEELVMSRLKDVVEPDLKRDIVTLNMVRGVTVRDHRARLTLVLSTPLWPEKGDFLRAAAHDAVLSVEGIAEAEIGLEVDIARTVPDGQMGLHMRNIVAVSSGKGGVGKSTVAVNLAVALAQAGVRVGLLDADITGPNIPILIGLYGQPPFTGEKLIPLEAYGVKVMSMGFLIDPDKPVIWRGPMIHHAIRQLLSDVEWGELDYMIVDLPPGTGDAQLTLAQSVPLTGALIVTQPQQVALGDALRGITMFEQVNVAILGIVENMSGELFGTGGGRRLAEQRGLPYLGSVPLDPEVRIGGDAGQPIVAVKPDSPAAQAFIRLAREITAHIGLMALEQGSSAVPLITLE